MHCPFTSEISKKRGREILILVMSYFFFFNVGVDTCVGSPPPPPTPLPPSLYFLPSKFNNYFSLNKQVHSYATRHANDFHLPFCRTNLRKFSVSFQGSTYYNSIGNDIKESNSLHLFKTKLKKKKCI